jgi:hypothetical protein
MPVTAVTSTTFSGIGRFQDEVRAAENDTDPLMFNHKVERDVR